MTTGTMPRITADSLIVVTCQCDWDCPSPNSRPCRNPITGPDGLCDYCRLIHERAAVTQDKLFHCHTCGISGRLATLDDILSKIFGGKQ